jgi:arsenite methyltransferase
MTSNCCTPKRDTENAVRERYTAAALERQAALCCPVDYDARYLAAIPPEVLERDYGCGDPSRHVREGDVVLDLGCGAGKICFIAAQIAGPNGAVIGVDSNDAMLGVARGSAPRVAAALGYANVRFARARIQDLALDLDALDAWLAEHPVRGVADLSALEDAGQELRRASVLIADASVDLVVSNCVLNLVREADRRQLVAEIFRVLKVGGRIAISDIVSDEVVPDALKADPELWSGCVSGAFQELELLDAFEAAGFRGIAIDKWEAEPFAVVQAIEFRSVTVTAHKPDPEPARDASQAVVYRGPWKVVEDERGNCFARGERTAVSAQDFDALRAAPFADAFVPIQPRVPVPEAEQPRFERVGRRDPRATKGEGDRATRKPGQQSCC